MDILMLSFSLYLRNYAREEKNMKANLKDAIVARLAKFSATRKALFQERVELAVAFRAKGEDTVHLAGAYGNSDNKGAIIAREGSIKILWSGTGAELLALAPKSAKARKKGPTKKK